LGRRAHLIRATLACAAAVAAGAAAAGPQRVEYASGDGTLLQAWWFKPAQPSKGNVIALHGCGGLYSNRTNRRGEAMLSARHTAMAEFLVSQGYAVLFPDSLTPRGEREICTQRIGARRVGQVQRRGDVLASVSWLSSQSGTSPQRIALLGWSHGGSAVLAATDGNREDVSSQRVQPALAIAFYPGCSAALQSNYKPATRLLMLLGESDDWTPAAPCVELGRRTGAEVHVFPDAYHGFDSPSGEVRIRSDVPNGVRPGEGVHVGPNPAAREQAYARVKQALAEAFR